VAAKKLRASIFLGGDWQLTQNSFSIFTNVNVCYINSISVRKKFAVTGMTILFIKTAATRAITRFEIIWQEVRLV
jgi:hypothetical protein